LRFILFLFWAFCGALHSAVGASETPPQAVNGVLDLRDWAAGDELIPIEGEWRFFWQEWLNPGTASERSDGILTPFARRWSRLIVDGRPIQGTGYGSYTLTILPPENAELALTVPRHRRCYVVYVNGEEAGRSGILSRTQPETMPAHSDPVIPLPVGSEPIHLLFQVSNHIDYYGVSPLPPLLGSTQALANHRDWALTMGLICLAGGLLFGLKYLLIYTFRKRYSAYLWLGLLALSVAFNQLAWMSPYQFTPLMLFDDQAWVLRAILISYFSIYVFLFAFLHSLYPDLFERRLALAAGLVVLLTLIPILMSGNRSPPYQPQARTGGNGGISAPLRPAAMSC
jgi:hypothetical protein